jgi:exosortase A-associated hydrolase 2
MAALQARAFADAGWLVLQIDLMGCGDSAGDFADATWSCWVNDVRQSAQWLLERCGSAPVMWGLRAGALVAVEAAAGFDVGGFVLWQPVLSGKQFLQQFLRLKAAGEMVAQGDRERTGTRALREQLARGEAVEIAGYTVSPELALGWKPQSSNRIHGPHAWRGWKSSVLRPRKSDRRRLRDCNAGRSRGIASTHSTSP